jgi:hypothetical protein
MGRIPRLRGWRGSGATAAGPASGGAPPAGPPPGRSARPRPRPRLPHHRLRQIHAAGTLIVASKARIDSLDALRGSPSRDLHQGDCIELPPAAIGVLEPPDPAGADAWLFQVIGADQHGNRCWLRRWPLAGHGSRCLNCPWARCRGRCRIGRCRWGGAWSDERGLGPAGAVKRSTTDPMGAAGFFMVILLQSPVL